MLILIGIDYHSRIVIKCIHIRRISVVRFMELTHQLNLVVPEVMSDVTPEVMSDVKPEVMSDCDTPDSF